jgi:hypothetical protein
MNCLQCAIDAHVATTAVAVCTGCGAGVCTEHAHLLTRAARPTGHIPASGATREIRCTACLDAAAATPTLRAPISRSQPVVAARR